MPDERALTDLERRRLLAFQWLSSVADTPAGWGTNYLYVMRDAWASGRTLLQHIESLKVYQDWLQRGPGPSLPEEPPCPPSAPSS